MGAYQTVVVGTDGSDSSYRAVDRAASIARDSAAKLVLVCAYHPASQKEVALAEDALRAEAYKVVGSAPAEETLRTAAERAAAAGADELCLADTIGVAVPRQVRALVGDVAALGRPFGVHLHNTRNTGYANALAALEAGATLLDASVGGIGGCPFAPRATGNIATEDLVYLLRGEGIDPGVDLEALIGIAAWLTGHLGHELPGELHRAGDFSPV
jgi:isopropylmalate/homocitrate/citramalate synthase